MYIGNAHAEGSREIEHVERGLEATAPLKTKATYNLFFFFGSCLLNSNFYLRHQIQADADLSNLARTDMLMSWIGFFAVLLLELKSVFGRIKGVFTWRSSPYLSTLFVNHFFQLKVCRRRRVV